MNTDAFRDFLLKSAITIMACDGNIHDEEINEFKKMAENEIYFMNYDFDQPLKDGINYIKSNGTKAINEYLNELSSENLKPKQELILIEVLINIIEADNKLEENEIKFLQMVKSKLSVTEETIISEFPEQIKYLIDFNNYGLNKEFIDDIKLS